MSSEPSAADSPTSGLPDEEQSLFKRSKDRAATGSAAHHTKVTYNHYGPHRNGLPPVRKYLRELWQRREFAFELSRANMRASSTDTVFGQLWMVLNPLLMAGVYWLLVGIISSGRTANDPTYFAHLTTNLFVFTFITTCANAGATSVTTAGKMLLNTAFPRLLIPLGAVHTAFFRFVPTLPVTLAIFLIWHNQIGWSPKQLLSAYFLFLMVLFGSGLAAFFSTMQVYFRDTNNFLPYFIRIWTYLSPVLWQVNFLAKGDTLHRLASLNPAYQLLGGYSSLLIHGVMPSLSTWVIATVWSVGVFLLGSLFFMSREREFAVRIY